MNELVKVAAKWRDKGVTGSEFTGLAMFVVVKLGSTSAPDKESLERVMQGVIDQVYQSETDNNDRQRN